MKKKIIFYRISMLQSFIVLLAPLLFSDFAFARDLVSASGTLTSTVKTIAQGMAVTGVISGGAIMQVPGAADFGKRVLVGGMIGCLCAFGAPGFLRLMQTVFGGL